MQILQEIQNDLRKRNIKPEEFSDQIIFMSMFNDIDWRRKGNDGICKKKSEKLRNARKDSRTDTGRFSVLETKRSGMELFFTHLKENGTLQLLTWWKDSKISVMSRGIQKKKNNRDTIRFNADASNTELLFRITHSVNQLSIYGAVSNWCEHFGLTEEEKGQEQQKGIHDQRCIDKCQITRSKTFGIFSKTSTWKQSAGNIQDLEVYDDVSTSSKRLVRDPEPTVEKKPKFEIDLRVERSISRCYLTR